MLSAKLSEERLKHTEEVEALSTNLAEKTKLSEQYKQEIIDLKGENLLVKRKLEMSLRVRVEILDFIVVVISINTFSDLNFIAGNNFSPRLI